MKKMPLLVLTLGSLVLISPQIRSEEPREKEEPAVTERQDEPERDAAETPSEPSKKAETPAAPVEKKPAQAAPAEKTKAAAPEPAKPEAKAA